MARGSSSRRSAAGSSGVSQSTITTPNAPADELDALLDPLAPAQPLGPSVTGNIADTEDDRFWHPDESPLRLARSVRIGVPGLYTVEFHRRPVIAYSKPIYAHRGLPKGLQVPVGLKTESPLFVKKCIGRKIRREVIFAKEKLFRTRSKGSGAKTRHRDRWSSVSC